jgi:uncharacterized membrane protein YraQ (UPF0718 family)
VEVHGTTQSHWRREAWPLGLLLAVTVAFYVLPLSGPGPDHPLVGPAWEGLALAHWYAREHVLTCLVPAFFIAGAIAVFVSRGAVMRYLGPQANRAVSYGVASLSGTTLAVCSCTVLPLFAGIYRRGAGLGPATTFLYAGPAINVLAIVLTARVLGPELGLARAVGAVGFSVVIGAVMHLLFRREERGRERQGIVLTDEPSARPAHQTATAFVALLAVLVFANWGSVGSGGFAGAVAEYRWVLTAAAALVLAVALAAWYGLGWGRTALGAAAVGVAVVLSAGQPLVPFLVGAVALAVLAATRRGETDEWTRASWGFAKQILPLLLVGVLAAGILLGRPGESALVPSRWIEAAVGGNTLFANAFASVAGACMYFATLTEIPILEGLIGSGMGDGPALALLLAGPALSLPNMLVIRSVLGTRKTVAFVILTIAAATASGLVYGTIMV